MTAAESFRLLIVDDEPDILKVLKRVFRGIYTVTVTDSPVEAAQLLEHEDFDMLISDIDMPALDGYDLVRLARRLCPTAIRVLITGVGTMEGAIRAINEGEVHRYISKPFTLPHIRQTVAEALARKRELDQVAEASERAERRRALEAEIEASHPGLTAIERDDSGVYRLDGAKTRAAAARLGLRPLLA